MRAAAGTITVIDIVYRNPLVMVASLRSGLVKPLVDIDATLIRG
jgi:hypothetical protein